MRENDRWRERERDRVIGREIEGKNDRWRGREYMTEMRCRASYTQKGRV